MRIDCVIFLYIDLEDVYVEGIKKGVRLGIKKRVKL